MLKSYVRIARLDHWGKNLFMVPGVALALGYRISTGQGLRMDVSSIAVSFGALCLVSSANYTINEWLDREFDGMHPWKSSRSAVENSLNPQLIWTQWLILAAAGICLTLATNLAVSLFTFWLVVMGIFYNVRPFRTKDVAYLDVISESVNNPIRMAIGWCSVVTYHPVPASAFIAFWGGGAFLMALKRYTEMSLVKDRNLMATYRKSFAIWTPNSLLLFAVLGALVSCSFLGVLLAGYRLEYVLLLPVLVGLFRHYLSLALGHDISAIRPEKLWKKKGLNVWVGCLVSLGIVLSFIDIPILESLAGF